MQAFSGALLWFCALTEHIDAERREVSEGVKNFIEGHLGRQFGAQLTLPVLR